MLFLSLLLIGVGLVSAQNSKKVTGIVVSEDDGQPVIGASIVAKGMKVGTVSDVDGSFTLNAPASTKIIVVSCIGMKTKEVVAGQDLKVVLSSNAQTTSEVIVTGYGNFKKASFTGAAATMSTDKLGDIPTVSVEDKIAGNIPGVNISSFSGAPGAVSYIRIRGMGSMNAGNDPLIVINGTPVMSGNVNSFSDGEGNTGYNRAGTNILSTLNSNDIESITVIKDAAAASLYGSRAANGVIVITTKSGSAGKTQFNYQSDWGFSNMAINFRPTLSGDDRRTLILKGLENYDLDQGATATAALAFANANIDDYAAKPANGWTNWRDLFFKTGSHQNYNISAQGGNEKTKFYTSLSYTKQQGITDRSGLERVTGDVNVSHTTGRFKIEASALMSSMHQNLVSEGTGYASPLMSVAWTCSPSQTPYNADGTWSTSFPLTSGINPMLSLKYNYDRNNLFRSYTTLSGTYTIWDNLKLSEKLSYDYNTQTEDVLWDKRTGDGSDYKGVLQRNVRDLSTLNTQTQLTYIKTFAKKHNVDALLGFETEDFNQTDDQLSGQDYPGYLYEITNAGTTTGWSNKFGYRMTSFLGRVNYNYSDLYYLGLSYRRDGSSRLARAHRWGDFWSVSGSWRFMGEDFMQSLKSVITDGKLRMSYGVNGTLPSDYYDYMSVYKYGENYDGQSGMGIVGIGNKDLKWEQNKAFNIGLDLSFGSRLSLTADYYVRRTSDLLMDKAISYVPGYYNNSTDYNATFLQNIGSLKNSGYEITLQSTNIQNKDLTWSTTFNISHNKNVLKKLDGVETQVIDGTYTRLIHKVGYAYNSYYVLEYAGVDPQTGNESYYLNDGTSNARTITTDASKAQRIVADKHDPTVEGGLTNYVKYKFVDFNMTITYSFGGHAYDDATWLHDNGGDYTSLGAIPSYYKLADMWTTVGQSAKLPKFEYGNTRINSTRWIMPTHYIRVKNLSVGLNAPQDWISKLGINKARVYFAANNLLTFKSSKLCVDPEMPDNGICRFQMPSLRTYTFGVELGF